MPNTTETELLVLSGQLLDAIDRQDWETYASLCDPSLSCFEPEALGQLVTGLDFHQFYFNMERTGRPKQSSICSPQVRVIGDAAIVTYVRVVQKILADGSAPSFACEETRVWQRQNGRWLHVHFHRSNPGS